MIIPDSGTRDTVGFPVARWTKLRFLLRVAAETLSRSLIRPGNLAALLDLRDEVATEAAAAGLTEERLAALLDDDGA